MQSPVLPSPLCDKELEDVIFRLGQSHMDDSETLHSAADGEEGGELKMGSQLFDWTSSAILTNKVQHSAFSPCCRPRPVYYSQLFCNYCLKKTL